MSDLKMMDEGHRGGIHTIRPRKKKVSQDEIVRSFIAV